MAGHTTTAPVNALDRIQLPTGTPYALSSSEAIIYLRKPPWLSANRAHHFLSDYTLYNAWGNGLSEALYNVPTLTITNHMPTVKSGDLIKIRHDPGKGKRPHHFSFMCKVPYPIGIDGIYSDL